MPDIEALRSQIDSIDIQLLQLISRRNMVAAQIGECKRMCGMPVEQPERFQQVLQSLTARAAKINVSEQCVRHVWEALQQEAINRQKP